jgi:hypothetical protein
MEYTQNRQHASWFVKTRRKRTANGRRVNTLTGDNHSVSDAEVSI